MCGEQTGGTRRIYRPEGSPPRVRGTGLFFMLEASSTRITPACAGNSIPAAMHARWPQDHPRVCGEQTFREVQDFFELGSPPRVRGTAASIDEFADPYGITPACAGNSFSGLLSESLHEDHPRVCGEQVNGTAQTSYPAGSPPRVRGTERR